MKLFDAENAEYTDYTDDADRSARRESSSRQHFVVPRNAMREESKSSDTKSSFSSRAALERGATVLFRVFRVFRGNWQFSGSVVLAVSVLSAALAIPSAAQIDPSHQWLSLRTEHFYIHFTQPVAPLARRIAGTAYFIPSHTPF